MLSELRRHSRSAIIYVLFAIIILAFLLTFNTMGRGGGCGAEGSLRMATVMGTEIDSGLLRMASFLTIDPPEPGNFTPQNIQRQQAYESTRFLRANSNMLLQHFMPYAEDISPLKFRRVMDDLIETFLVSDYAERLGMAVPDDDLADRVYRNPYLRDYWYDANGVFQRRQFFSFVQYSLGTGVRSYEDFIRREMLREQVIGFLTNQVTLAEAEVSRAYALQNDKVDLNFVEFDPEKIVRTFEVAAEEKAAVLGERSADIETYYEDNRGRYEREERARVQGIFIQSPLQILIDRAEGEERETLEAERMAARAQAEEVLGLLRAAEEAEETVPDAVMAEGDETDAAPPAGAFISQERFATLAGERSQHFGTKDAGGDFGETKARSAYEVWPFGEGVPDALFALEPGEVTEVLAVQNGYWILRLVEKLPEERRSLEEVREDIARILALEGRTDELTRGVAEAFLNKARGIGAEERDLTGLVATWNEEHASEPLIEVSGTGPFALVSPVPGAPWGSVPLIGLAENVAREAFALTDDGAFGADVYEVERGGRKRYYVIQLAERLPAEEDLELREQLRENLLLEKQKRHYRAWYRALYEAATASRDVRETKEFESLVDSERRQREERLLRLQQEAGF